MVQGEIIPKPKETKRDRAIKFATWITKNKYLPTFDGFWRTRTKFYTTTELYEVFKQEQLSQQ